MNWRGYIQGTMNGLGACWMWEGFRDSLWALVIIGAAVFLGQYVVQLWPYCRTSALSSPHSNPTENT